MEEKSLRKYSIVGFPDELGIKNVNGRLGASQGPQAFMDVFSKLKGSVKVKEHCQGAILVKMTDDLEKNHELASQEVSKAILPLIAIGGGHDYAYSWIKGLSTKQDIGCINLDAHFDLRPFDPIMTSGSPFRRLIEEKIIKSKNLIEFGIQEHCNGPDLWEYAAKNKIKTIPFDRVRKGNAVLAFKKELAALGKNCKKIVISLDLDALSFAYAPGVSAPQAEGFTASEVFEMLEIAGSNKKVISLGIFELSPPLDQGDLTARLAAQAAWHFIAKKIK